MRLQTSPIPAKKGKTSPTPPREGNKIAPMLLRSKRNKRNKGNYTTTE